MKHETTPKKPGRRGRPKKQVQEPTLPLEKNGQRAFYQLDTHSMIQLTVLHAIVASYGGEAKLDESGSNWLLFLTPQAAQALQKQTGWTLTQK